MLALNSPVMQFTMYMCILAISWLGAHMIAAQSLTTGQLMSLFTYVMNILMSLMMLSMIFVMVTMARASADRIAEVLEEKADLTSPPAARTQVEDGRVDFDHVSFSYKKSGKPVLDDIDLHIRAGETIGIIGGTGSAKSSLVQLIPRLYDVAEGAVRVGGVDVREYDVETLRNEVAMVLQKNVLFSGTIRENLRWGDKNATDEEMERACRLAQADEFIRALPDGYDTYIEQGGTNVSGGQKQRLCIARAAEKAQDTDPGRFHQRRGYPDGYPDPPGFRRGDPRHHEIHHRPAHQLRAGRRPHPRAGRRPRGRLRHARRAACEQRNLPGCL